MKKIFTIISLFAFSAMAFAQNPRMVLVEHFTQASCGPCAPANRTIEPIMQSNINSGKLIAIKHQVSWPGYDPMNEHNPNEINLRRTYYGLNSVPITVMDGFGPRPSTSLVTQANIDAAADVSSPFIIELDHKIRTRFDGVNATMKITATEATSGTFRGHIVVIEKEIIYGSAPGSNGEKEFYNVAKKFLPNASGSALPSNWAAGETRTIDVSWDFKNVFDITQIAVVGFIQNNRDKQIMQAAFSDANLVAAGPYDALVTRASGEGDFSLDGLCGNDAAPLVEIMNAGTSTMTDLDIFYKINGGKEYKYEWSGFLGFLQKTSVTLPAIKFDTKLDNYINIRTANPNGDTDAQERNDDYFTRFNAAAQTTPSSYISARPGPLPSGVTWEVIDDEGNIVATGGPYSTPLQAVRTDITLEPDNCYKLIANNVSSSLNGYVRLFDENDNELTELVLNEKGDIRTDFGTFNISNLDKVLNINSLNIYPNPTSTSSVVEFSMIEAAKMNFVLTNTIGQVVWSETEDLNTGNQIKEIEVSNIPNGIYFLQLKTDEGSATKQIVIQR